jgi:hypothetical protein
MTSFQSRLSKADYAAIETALLASEKGRLFLEAYLANRRGTDTARLLGSLSRLHKATVGEPELYVELAQDLKSIRRRLMRIRASRADREGARCWQSVAAGLDEIEAHLMVLIEALEDRIAETAAFGEDGTENSFLCSPEPIDCQREKLYGELSSLFSGGCL